MKICSKCNKLLDDSCFSIKRASKDGLSNICRKCKSEYDRKFYQKEKEIIKEKGKIDIEDKNIIIGNDFKILICEKCGKEFKVGRKSNGKDFLTRKYCSDCSTNVPFKLRKCKECGKEFKIERSPDGRHFRNIWKCEDCRKPQTEKTVLCEKCNKSFTVTKYDGTNSFKKIRFCSNFCASTQTEFRDGKVQLKQKYSVCKHCGKKIKLQFDLDNFHWILRTVCDDCLKPKEKPKYIERACSICGKLFKAELQLCGNYSSAQYCSDECASEGFKIKCIKTCRTKYGVDYPCQTEQALEKGNVISEINKRFAKLLNENNIEFEQEFALEGFAYDFKIDNLLVEINPTYTHNIYYNHFGKVKDKNYHYVKSKVARKNNYICIHVWDWNNWDKIINLIKQKDKLQMKWIGIQLYYSKRFDKVRSNIEIDEELINKGYLPIYTDGFIVEIGQN